MIARKKVETVIGKEFADKLDEVVFDVGSLTMRYSRRQMVEKLGCANFIAAARLQKVLRKLNVDTTLQLFKLDPFSLARSKGIGETSLFVAMCILESDGFNSIDWWQYKGNAVKFSTFKHHAMRRARRRKQEVA